MLRISIIANFFVLRIQIVTFSWKLKLTFHSLVSIVCSVGKETVGDECFIGPFKARRDFFFWILCLLSTLSIV